MSVSTPVHQIEVPVPVPVYIIPGGELRETRGGCILGHTVTEILAPLADRPGFIGFKAKLGPETEAILNGPDAHLLFENVTCDGIAEIGIFGKVSGPLINWDRWVYALDEASGLFERVFQVPFGAEVWVCEYITEATCGSLMSAFYTPGPNEPLEG